MDLRGLSCVILVVCVSIHLATAENAVDEGEDNEQYLRDGEEFLTGREKRDTGGNEYIAKYDDDRKRRAVDGEDYLAEDDEDYRRKREVNEEDNDGYRKKREAGGEEHVESDDQRTRGDESDEISEEYREKRDAREDGANDDHFDDEDDVGGQDHVTVDDYRQRRGTRCGKALTLLSKILRGCLQYQNNPSDIIM